MQFPTSALFVGRETELVEIARLLSDPACRLLTLVGPGGIGKTRLGEEKECRQLNTQLHNLAHLVTLV